MLGDQPDVATPLTGAVQKEHQRPSFLAARFVPLWQKEQILQSSVLLFAKSEFLNALNFLGGGGFRRRRVHCQQNDQSAKSDSKVSHSNRVGLPDMVSVLQSDHKRRCDRF